MQIVVISSTIPVGPVLDIYSSIGRTSGKPSPAQLDLGVVGRFIEVLLPRYSSRLGRMHERRTIPRALSDVTEEWQRRFPPVFNRLWKLLHPRQALSVKEDTLNFATDV